MSYEVGLQDLSQYAEDDEGLRRNKKGTQDTEVVAKNRRILSVKALDVQLTLSSFLFMPSTLSPNEGIPELEASEARKRPLGACGCEVEKAQ